MALQFPLTDSGNVARMLKVCGHRFCFVKGWNRFYVWTGRKWEDDPHGYGVLGLTACVIDHIAAELKEITDDPEHPRRGSLGLLGKWWARSQSLSSRQAIVGLLRSEAECQVPAEDWNAHPWLLNVANGTLNLKTGELQKHNPSNRLTEVCSMRFHDKATAPNWARYLETALPDVEVRAFLQRFVGYCLTGLSTERMICVCVGQGGSGKSVFLNAIQRMLGPYAGLAQPGLLLARQGEAHPTELAALYGKRLMTASEVKKGQTWDEAKLKRLTGNDAITARKMHQDFWEFRPTHKIIIAANDKPKVFDASSAFWSRMTVVPFTQCFDDIGDKALDDKLSGELSGILNWALEGCLAWQQGGLKPPAAVREKSDEYREDEDLIGAFISEALVFEPTARMTYPQLVNAVELWCRAQGLRTPFQTRFVTDRLMVQGARRFKSDGQRHILGVRVKTAAERSRPFVGPN